MSSAGHTTFRAAQHKTDDVKVSDREYNPHLRGEKSELPEPESVSSIPKHLCVGDGGASWRKRAQKRAAEQEREAGAPPPADEGPASRAGRRREDPPRDQSPLPGGVGRRTGGPTGGGWRAAKAPRNTRARQGSRSRSKSRSRRRSRSPRRRRSRSRSRSSPSVKRPKPKERTGADEADDVLKQLQQKYSGAPAGGAKGSTAAATEAEDNVDANTLGAMAMEAMLSGDMEKYEELNKRLERKQAAISKAALPAAEDAPVEGETSGNVRVKVIEEVDAAGRNRSLLESVQTTSVHTKGRNKRGQANAVPGKDAKGYYQDDEISLGELLKKERIEGVQDYDSNFASHILKKGSKFKMLNEDEDEAYALGWYEHSSKKMEAAKCGQKQHRQQANDTNRVQVNLDQCTRCMESKRFGRRESVISVSPLAYVCVDGFNQCVLPGQVFIAPQEHVTAITDLDEAAYAEIRNYQKCLVRFFESQEPPKAVLFIESAVHRVSREKALLGGGGHAAIVAYPIELPLLDQARGYWKKALDEAENEFETTHKKVIPTDTKGGVRRAVPKGFPYIHVDFCLGGGYAHIVDNVVDFQRDFVQHTIAGMCELTILDRAYASKDEYRNAGLDLRARFSEGYDWTQVLKG